MQLTLTGEALRQHASDILLRVEQIDSDLDQIGQPQIPLLRVGLLPSLATRITPVVIETARSLYGVPVISLHADLADVHRQMIKSRQVDLLVTSRAFYDLDGLNRIQLMQEDFLLILPPAFDGRVEDLEKLAAELPLIRFSASTPAGLLVDQHLRRCDVALERRLDADRTTMIMAAVAAGQGFSILSPTLLLDGITEGMQLRITRLPLKPLRRAILLLNRAGELDRLPQRL